jgi:hypothetical protein
MQPPKGRQVLRIRITFQQDGSIEILIELP